VVGDGGGRTAGRAAGRARRVVRVLCDVRGEAGEFAGDRLAEDDCACRAYQRNASGLSTEEMFAAFSSGLPVSNFLIGTSSRLPVSVCGTAGAATISSGT